MISSVTPPAELYLQWNTDYWADDILGDSTSRGIYPVKHWLLGGWYPRWLQQQRYISSETLTTGRFRGDSTSGGWYPRWLRQQRYISSETLTTGRMISSVTPPAEVYLQWNTDYWADDILGDPTSRGISPVKHWLLGGWFPRWLHQHRYISSETLTTGWMISSVTPPAGLYLQWNTDYWADDILVDSTSRGIYPVKHWLLGGWYPRWLHQQRYISSETLTTGRMISAMTPPAEVYLQWNTDYWEDDILGDSTSRGISPVKHWLLGGWYPRWLHQQMYISSETLTTGRMISSVTPPAEVYLQWNTDYWADDIRDDSTSRGISPVKHWLLGGWYPRWLHQQSYISSETLTTGRMKSSVTPPAEVYIQWNTDYWADDIPGDSTSWGITPVKHWLLGGSAVIPPVADDILGDSASRGISPVVHWLLGDWYPRWLHQQRYISSETLTTGRMISSVTPPAEVYLQWKTAYWADPRWFHQWRMISSVTPPAEVYLQWNTDYWADDILGDSTSRGISPVKHWLLSGWYPRWLHQQRCISSKTLTTGRMIFPVTPPAEVYLQWITDYWADPRWFHQWRMISSVTPPAEVNLQWNTDYWANDILRDSTSRGISPVKHWLLGGWYPRWLHQQRYISSETLTTGRMISSVTPQAEVYLQRNTDYWGMISSVTPPAEVYLQWNTDYWADWYPRWPHQQRYISSETLTTGRMISAMTPPAEVYRQLNTDYWADDILGDTTSRCISPVKHWLLGGWYPRWLHQQRYISSETLTTGRMISSVTPPAEVYLQWNTDYWAVDILGDPTSRGISPVKHWLLGGWYPRWLHQQRYISSETLTTGRLISSVTPPAEVYLQWNTDYWADDIRDDSTSRGISPVKHWLLGGWYPRWHHQ